MRAAAEPRPDDPDNRRDDEIQVTRVPDDPEVCNLLLCVDGERDMTTRF
jgi:hypothetical protein